jgi:anti-sigma factor RsiW
LSDIDLWAYADDELAGAERSAVERHLADCTDCAARLGQIRRPLFKPEMAMPPPTFQHQVMARLMLATQHREWESVPAWLAPLLNPRRLAAASTLALMVALMSAGLAGAALALPAVEVALPVNQAPIANSMVMAMRAALSPLGPFFERWAWCVLGLGMAMAVLMPAMRALTERVQEQL